MAEQRCDVLVIGGGPGGYVAAIRAAQLGKSVVCVERDKTLGGTCVNIGCIPSKALLETSHHYEFIAQHAAVHGISTDKLAIDLPTMQKRKDDVVAANCKGVEFLFRKNKITWAQGEGTLKAGNLVEVKAKDGTVTQFRATDVIIATGSVPIALPFLPFDEERVLSNVGALTLLEVPKHLVVIGGGVIGLELGSVWRRLGAKVTVVEMLPAILPGNDADVVKEAERAFKKQGLDIRTGTKVTGAKKDKKGVKVDIEKDGAKETLDADYVLVAIGRKPLLSGVDAAALGLKLGALLAHKAEEEGVIATETIAGKNVAMHYGAIPAVVYTWPEIVAIGATEQQAKEAGTEVKTGKFPFSANGRARTMGENTGFIKVIADAKTDRILGMHMIGPTVSELAAEAVLAMEFRGTSEDIGITVHAHPTLSEATKEAALGVLGRSIHI